MMSRSTLMCENAQKWGDTRWPGEKEKQKKNFGGQASEQHVATHLWHRIHIGGCLRFQQSEPVSDSIATGSTFTPALCSYSFKKMTKDFYRSVKNYFLLRLLTRGVMWSDWSASFSLDHPIYTPASRGNNKAFDYFYHFLDVIQGLASNKIIPCLIPWAWKLQYWVTCVSREVKGQLLPPAPSFRRLVETKKTVGFLCYWVKLVASYTRGGFQGPNPAFRIFFKISWFCEPCDLIGQLASL